MLLPQQCYLILTGALKNTKQVDTKAFFAEIAKFSQPKYNMKYFESQCFDHCSQCGNITTKEQPKNPEKRFKCLSKNYFPYRKSGQ